MEASVSSIVPFNKNLKGRIGIVSLNKNLNSRICIHVVSFNKNLKGSICSVIQQELKG